MANVCVNFGAFKALLQIVVDGLIGDFAKECQVGDANVLLLGCFEGSLLRLCAAADLRTRSSGLAISGGFIFRSPRYSLYVEVTAVSKALGAMAGGEQELGCHTMGGD